MKKVGGFLKGGFKLLAITLVSGSALGYGYLQYVNSKLGPISLNRQQALKYYKNKYDMNQQKANITYYWVIYNIGLARILSYNGYASYCQRLNTKIIEYALNNYQQANIFEEIQKAGPIKSNKSVHKKINNKITQIRKKNAQNVDDREYLISGIMQRQRQMNCDLVVGVPQDNIDKILKLYNYILELNQLFNGVKSAQKEQKWKKFQQKFPNDFLHKLLYV